MSVDIECPYCHTIQSDIHNGGDPGEWWNTEYIPDGECDVECDGCQKKFVVEISWSPSFEGLTPEEED